MLIAGQLFGVATPVRAGDDLTLRAAPEALQGYAQQGNGTVIDRGSGLVWLENPACFGKQTWQSALDAARAFGANDDDGCGLRDNSRPGDWRLPNINELATLTDFASRGPAIARGNPIKVGRAEIYWSSSYMARDKARAWSWEALDGHVRPQVKNKTLRFMPVRDARADEWPVVTLERGDLAKAKRIGLAGGELLKTLVVTGQTDCYDANGSAISCKGTGQDGEYQRGFRVAGARFSDRGDGTVLDRYTGHVVLKDPKCLGHALWDDGMARIAALASGACGLKDESKPGDWRNFTAYEFHQIAAWDRGGAGIPSLTAGHPFRNIATYRYWSANKCAVPLNGRVCGWAFSMEGVITTDDAGPDGQERWFWALRRDEPAQQVLNCAVDGTLRPGEWAVSCKGYGKQTKLRVQAEAALERRE